MFERHTGGGRVHYSMYRWSRTEKTPGRVVKTSNGLKRCDAAVVGLLGPSRLELLFRRTRVAVVGLQMANEIRVPTRKQSGGARHQSLSEKEELSWCIPPGS